MGLWIQQPGATDETDVAEPKGVGVVANGICPHGGLCAVQHGHRQAQADSLGRGVRDGDVRRVDVVDDRLAEGRETVVDLIAQEKLIAMEIAVTDRDSPFAGPEIRQLGFALSPQTGGCESDRGSALGERLPREHNEADDDRQDCHWVNAHRTSSSWRLESATAPAESPQALAGSSRS